ncbi:STAS domain-containing protein [Streptomyces sp. NPDC054838]
MDSFFEISVERTGPDAVRISPVGEIDHTAQADLEAVLATLPGGAAVVLDMSRVSFMDLTGLQFLLDLRRLARASGAPILIAGWQRQPRRLLDLAAGLGGEPSGSGRHRAVAELRDSTRDRAELERFLGSAQAPAEAETATGVGAGQGGGAL